MLMTTRRARLGRGLKEEGRTVSLRAGDREASRDQPSAAHCNPGRQV